MTRKQYWANSWFKKEQTTVPSIRSHSNEKAAKIIEQYLDNKSCFLLTDIQIQDK